MNIKHSKSLLSLVMNLIENSIKLIRSESERSIMNDIFSTLRMSRWTLNEKLKYEETTFTELLKSAEALLEKISQAKIALAGSKKKKGGIISPQELRQRNVLSLAAVVD